MRDTVSVRAQRRTGEHGREMGGVMGWIFEGDRAGSLFKVKGDL